MVQLSTQEEAAAAIEALDGQDLSAVLSAIEALDGQDLSAVLSAIEALDGQDLSAVLSAGGSEVHREVCATMAIDPGATAVRSTVRFAGAEQNPSDNLYLQGLPSPAVDKQSLDHLFKSIGLTVVRSRVLPGTPSSSSADSAESQAIILKFRVSNVELRIRIF